MKASWIRTASTILACAMIPLGLLSACSQSSPVDEYEEDAETELEPVIVQDRFLVTRSAYGFDATLRRLLEALDRRELTIFAVIDHAAAAEQASADLPGSTLVIFGNPETGSALMAEVPLLGAELPLRALVFERGGNTYLAVTGIANLVRSYPLDDQDALLDRMERLLSAVTDEVTAS